MNDILRQAFDQYDALDPRDRGDAAFYMCTRTRDVLAVGLPEASSFTAETMLGLPVRIDESVPVGAVRLIAESEFDRMIRRAGREWRTVNVMHPIGQAWAFTVPETPTLKALVRHWMKRLRKILS